MYAIFYSDDGSEYLDKFLDVYPDYYVAVVMARCFLPGYIEGIDYAIVPVILDGVA